MCTLAISYTQTKYSLLKQQVLTNPKCQFLTHLRVCLSGGGIPQVCEVTGLSI